MLSLHKSSTAWMEAKYQEEGKDSTTADELTNEGVTMEFQEFIKSRFCRPLVLPEEDCPQDASEWRRLVKEDQERQFTEYHRVGVVAVEKTDEERRVERFLADKLPLQVKVVQVTPDSVVTGHEKSNAKFDKVAYQREYMRKRRAKEKEKQ